MADNTDNFSAVDPIPPSPPLENLGQASYSSGLEDSYLSVDQVQQHLRRSRASVYRYANTDPDILNPPFNPNRLNPEVRQDRDAPLQFHVREVRRFARDVLGLAPTIAVQPSEETVTQGLMREILVELRAIRQHLETREGRSE
jgi:hypothetical protein